jgi:penicillin V acylase-like amidase (Ntn superfamily)
MRIEQRVIAILCAILSFYTPIQACSRIFWNDNKIAKIAVRSMDLYLDEKPKLVIMPQGITKDGAVENPITWTSKYGSVVVTAFDQAVSDGVNDQGLSAHVLYLHESEYEKRDRRPGLANAKWVEFVLDNYKTVAEVVKHVEQFQVVSIPVNGREWPLHLVIEDASGDSAIFEFLQRKAIVYYGKQFTVMTNDPPYNTQLNNLKHYRYFGGNLPLPGDTDPQSRFVRCSAFLKTLLEPSNYLEAIAFAIGVIRTCQVPFGADKYAGKNETEEEMAWPTRWITATDLTNRIYYFNATVIPNIAWVELDNVNFKKGAPILELELYDPKVEGEVSHLFHQRNADKPS